MGILSSCFICIENDLRTGQRATPLITPSQPQSIYGTTNASLSHSRHTSEGVYSLYGTTSEESTESHTIGQPSLHYLTRDECLVYQNVNEDEDLLVARAERLGLIQFIPVVDWSREHHGGSGQEECSVCMEDYMPGDKVRFLPCMHYFHAACVDSWLESSFTCPICMFVIPMDVDILAGNVKEMM